MLSFLLGERKKADDSKAADGKAVGRRTAHLPGNRARTNERQRHETARAARPPARRVRRRDLATRPAENQQNLLDIMAIHWKNFTSKAAQNEAKTEPTTTGGTPIVPPVPPVVDTPSQDTEANNRVVVARPLNRPRANAEAQANKRTVKRKTTVLLKKKSLRRKRRENMDEQSRTWSFDGDLDLPLSLEERVALLWTKD